MKNTELANRVVLGTRCEFTYKVTYTFYQHINSDTCVVNNIERNGEPLTWDRAITALCDGTLGPFLMNRLRASPFNADLFWETSPFSQSALKEPFEFATTRASHTKPASPDSFTEHWQKCGASQIVTFANSGKDATLVVPCELEDHQRDLYAHLAKFAQAVEGNTPLFKQQEALWRAVGEEARERAKEETFTWISTEGTGVPWLHVRLDRIPKYIKYQPYIWRALQHNPGTPAWYDMVETYPERILRQAAKHFKIELGGTHNSKEMSKILGSQIRVGFRT